MRLSAKGLSAALVLHAGLWYLPQARASFTDAPEAPQAPSAPSAPALVLALGTAVVTELGHTWNLPPFIYPHGVQNYRWHVEASTNLVQWHPVTDYVTNADGTWTVSATNGNLFRAVGIQK